MTNPLADVIAKLDEARALTAAIQTDYRIDRAKRLRIAQRVVEQTYRERWPERYKAIHTTSAARRRVKIGHCEATSRFVRFLHQTQTKCPHCFRLLSETGKSLDHIIPLVMGGTHTPDNLILLCRSCNSAKGPKLNWPPPYRFLGKTHKQLSCFD